MTSLQDPAFNHASARAQGGSILIPLDRHHTIPRRFYAMNDPGLEEPLRTSASKTEHTFRKRLQQITQNKRGANRNPSTTTALRRELQSDENQKKTNTDHYIQPK
jgi:hypothetical protein